MSKDQKVPEWLIWFSEHGVRILILLAIAFMALVYTRSRSATEERLHAIEDRVEYGPPSSYRPPDLDKYAAVGVSVDSLDVHRAAYVPIYSHVYYDGGRPYVLETMLSIRNVDPKERVYVSAANYYDTDGKLSGQKLDRLIKLEPLQTIEFLIERTDATGGSGANFIVEWHAATKASHAPLIEAVMVGRSGTNAISFVRKSEPLPEWIAK